MKRCLTNTEAGKIPLHIMHCSTCPVSPIGPCLLHPAGILHEQHNNTTPKHWSANQHASHMWSFGRVTDQAKETTWNAPQSPLATPSTHLPRSFLQNICKDNSRRHSNPHPIWLRTQNILGQIQEWLWVLQKWKRSHTLQWYAEDSHFTFPVYWLTTQPCCTCMVPWSQVQTKDAAETCRICISHWNLLFPLQLKHPQWWGWKCAHPSTPSQLTPRQKPYSSSHKKTYQRCQEPIIP